MLGCLCLSLVLGTRGRDNLYMYMYETNTMFTNVFHMRTFVFVIYIYIYTVRLHADNDHLFWHTTLPPHVINMFLPSFKQEPEADQLTQSDRELVGWTAFIPGTHNIDEAARAIQDPSTFEKIEPRLNGESQTRNLWAFFLTVPLSLSISW